MESSTPMRQKRKTMIFVAEINRSVRFRLREEPDAPPLRPAFPKEGAWSRWHLKLGTKNPAALVSIINAVLRLQYFPEKQKKAHGIVIPKSGQNHAFPNNHRPISLLSTLGKIIQGVMLARHEEEIEGHVIFQNE
ncbi:hypothetical protein ILUMI_16216 [Ignelater luminosus]|uniref:Uncharacterized protein n=1 Tax=Ignelater luminosus TaxID=2038154 RepID=A0A8K0CM71_IGNLU|nr:hypothetical protein ILUMI_16216 [Ignelater luminosus]